MKIKQKSRKNTVQIITILTVVVSVGLLLGYLLSVRGSNTPLVQQNQNPDQQTPVDDKKNNDKTTPTNTDHPAKTETDATTGKRVVPVVASANIYGDFVYIRGGINTPETDGACYAVLFGPKGEKLQKDTTLLPNASSADCKTISIPTSELSTGQWSFTLNFLSNDTKGESSVVTFTIN